MATIKKPVRGDYTGSDVTGLAEFQAEEVISVAHGGTGISSVTGNGILVGYDTNTLTQVLLPDNYFLMGGPGDTLVSTNIINCGRVSD